MYDKEAELSSSGIFELVYERFVVKNLIVFSVNISSLQIF